MPSIGLRTELLRDLEDHHRDTQHARHQRCVLDLMSDLSDDTDDDSRSTTSEISAMSVVSPVSPDVSMASLSSSLSASGSASYPSDLSDVEEYFYLAYERCYHETILKIETTRVLNPGPPIPKLSQLPILDHFREYSRAHWRRKLRVDPHVFDSLLELIRDDPVFHNNSVPRGDAARCVSIPSRALRKCCVARGHCKLVWNVRWWCR